ncbi:MAG TPA: hypothetical protein VGN88_10465 [Phycisphaerae bacterium]|jgi:hypothetical protein
MLTRPFSCRCLSLIAATAALALLQQRVWAHPTFGTSVLARDSTELISNVRDGVVCFAYLIGAVAGIAGLFLRRKLAGLLFFLACGFFALDPIAEIIVFKIMESHSSSDYETSQLIFSIVSGVGTVLGMICFIAALYTAKPKPKGPQVMGNQTPRP